MTDDISITYFLGHLNSATNKLFERATQRKFKMILKCMA